jgi:hypothetical protein
MTIDDLLRSILNPHPGGNQLAQAGAGYLPQTGLSPDMVARFHQMSGMGGPQAAPQASAAPQMAPQSAPMPQAAPSRPAGSAAGQWRRFPLPAVRRRAERRQSGVERNSGLAGEAGL